MKSRMGGRYLPLEEIYFQEFLANLESCASKSKQEGVASGEQLAMSAPAPSHLAGRLDTS